MNTAQFLNDLKAKAAEPTQERASMQEEQATADFAAYATGAAFALTLSPHHIFGLGLLRSGDRETIQGYSRAIPMLRGLMRRGLVIHDFIPIDRAPKGHRTYRLSEAGEHVVRLLELAGLLPTMRP